MRKTLDRRRLLWATLAAFITTMVHAQTIAPNPKDVLQLAPVTVSGVLPGPALWKVSKGDHVMWVLGLTSPLPKKMQWESEHLDQLIAESQQVLKAPDMAVGARVGFWGRLFLIPSMIGIKKLPDGQTLKQVLPPYLYGRWQVQKEKYLSGSWGIDRLRPYFAGKKLYAAVIERSGLTEEGGVEKAIYATAEHDKVTITDTTYVIVMQDPRADAKLFKKVSMGDQQCLSGVLDATEQSLLQATVRANAWATGDLGTLRTVFSNQQQDDCLTAIGNTDVAKKLGMTDIAARIEQTWVKAAESAIDHDKRSVALLPMAKVLSSDGYLAALQAAGYTVTAPAE